MRRNPSSCLSVFMRTSSLAGSCLHFHHSFPSCSSIACLHGFSYLLSTDSNQLPQQRLQEAKLFSNSRKIRTFSHTRQLPGGLFSVKKSLNLCLSSNLASSHIHYDHHYFPSYSFSRKFFKLAKPIQKIEFNDQHSQRAITTALWCNFLVFSLKFVVWLSTSSHVMLAEVVHSLADFANQALLAYGLRSSRRAPDALHNYGYSKERFVWSLTSAVGIFCLGSAATIVHGFQNLWTSQPLDNIQYAALVIGGSLIIEGASLVVAIQAVKKGAAAEGMKFRDYVWQGHDPTSVAVMAEDGAAVTGLMIAGASLVAVNMTGNAIYDPLGSIVVGNLLGMVAIFLFQRNRGVLIGRAMDDNDVEKVIHFLKNDPVVDSLYDCKSEVIGPGIYRFKAEIDFNGAVMVRNYLNKIDRKKWSRQILEVAEDKDEATLQKILWNHEEEVGEKVVTAIGSEIDRLEKEIQKLVPGIRHVDIEAHNPPDLPS